MSNSPKGARSLVAVLDQLQDPISAATAVRLEQAGYRVVGLADDDFAEVVEETAAANDGIDAVIIRARPTPADRWLEMGAAELAAAVANLIQPALALTQAVIPHLMRAGGGQIVHVVSSVGRYRSAWFRKRSAPESFLVQAAVEGALTSQMRQLAFELAQSRIRVNAVAHGWVRGVAPEPDEGLSDEERDYLLTEISLRRRGEPGEVAAAIAFLAGPASRYVTGTVLDVNGGWWMS